MFFGKGGNPFEGMGGMFEEAQGAQEEVENE